ncbi:DUF6498-containing protein [Candidatus Cloacimonadota bacterium]
MKKLKQMLSEKDSKKIHLNFQSPSTILLILVNLLPIYGVLFWEWKVFPLILLFWLENVFVGFFNVLKMIISKPEEGANWLGKIFIVPFFAFHYGMFTAVHGIFVVLLFGSESMHFSGLPGLETVVQIINTFHLEYVALMLFLSHGFSFLWNYVGKKEYKSAELKTLMARPYGRIVVLHLTIIFGGFLLKALGSPVAGLILFILLKIFMDVSAHSKEHKNIEEIDSRQDYKIKFR